MKQGQITERGTHEELRADKGLYEQMWQSHIAAAKWRLGEETKG